MIIKESLSKRGVQTTITFPLFVYEEILERSESEGVSVSEIVRRAVRKEFETDKELQQPEVGGGL